MASSAGVPEGAAAASPEHAWRLLGHEGLQHLGDNLPLLAGATAAHDLLADTHKVLVCHVVWHVHAWCLLRQARHSTAWGRKEAT